MTKKKEYPPVIENNPNDIINKLIFKDIWNQVKYNDQAYFGSIIGPMGSGKSWWCLYMGLVLGYNEKMEREFSVDRNVIFDLPTYLTVIRRPAYKGEPLLYEEAETTVNSQEHYKEEVIISSKIISTQRSRNPIALFNLPAETQIAASLRRLRIGQFVFKKAYKQKGYSTFTYESLDYPLRANDYTNTKFQARLKRVKLAESQVIDESCGLKIRNKYNIIRFHKPQGRVWDKTVEEYIKKKDNYVDSIYDEYYNKLSSKNTPVSVVSNMSPDQIIKDIELNSDNYKYPRTNEYNMFKIQESFNISKTTVQLIMRELKKKKRYIKRDLELNGDLEYIKSLDKKLGVKI